MIFVLGVDQAARSGWAVACMGKGQVSPSVGPHGVATTHEHRKSAVAQALELAREAFELTREAIELLVVFEDHSGIPIGDKARFSAARGAPTRNVGTFLGMGEAKGLWQAVLNDAGVAQSHRLSVEPRVWRAAVLGARLPKDTSSLKALACQWASARTGAKIVDDNEAEAIAIACWGAREGVGEWLRARNTARSDARDKRALKKQGDLGL